MGKSGVWKFRILFGAVVLVSMALLLAACGGRHSTGKPIAYGGEKSKKAAPDSTSTAASDSARTSPLTYASPDRQAEQNQARADSSGSARPIEQPSESRTRALESDLAMLPGSEDPLEDPALYYGAQVDNEDSASAVDDAVWRMLDLAEEYHQMGVIANREASWEEAQYYFEKAIKVMAGLDVESDSIPTPEAVRYNTIMDNLVSDYRVTMRSLGQLDEDVTPSVLVERFGDLEPNLGRDTVRVFGQREQPITYDLPVKMNDRVKSSIIYFQTVAREAFTRYLSRSKKYETLYRRTLARYDLPQDLIYLSLVESGFNPRAYSWARASGLWQFIASTGRLYGLKRDWWTDERRDPEKSTDAAARFLKDLYTEFGDWELAMAAYNGGPGRVRKTISSQKTTDFWKMRLRRQTMDYVPLIYAAAIIAKDPERYGFYYVNFEPEWQYDEVPIDRCLELKVVAREVGCTVEELRDLNPELLRDNTPPNLREYKLRIPRYTKEKFMAAYDSMPSPKESSWVRHEIRRGETVSSIASKYGVSQYAIIEANNLKRGSKIIAGKTLLVPVPLDRGYGGGERERREYQAEGSVYTVRSGDTMWDIARAFGSTVDELRRINYLQRGSRIYVGQKLKLPSGVRNVDSPKVTTAKKTYAAADGAASRDAKVSESGVRTHKVRAGDTLWDIARRYGTTTHILRQLNGLSRTSRIYPGQVLTVNGDDTPQFVFYQVRRGDSLSDIARKHRTSIARILATNDLTDPDNIQVGQVLRIKVD